MLPARNLALKLIRSLWRYAAYAFSVVATLAPDLFPASFRTHGDQIGVYFEPAAVIVVLVLLGQVLELRARSQTSSAIKKPLSALARSSRSPASGAIRCTKAAAAERPETRKSGPRRALFQSGLAPRAESRTPV